MPGPGTLAGAAIGTAIAVGIGWWAMQSSSSASSGSSDAAAQREAEHKAYKDICNQPPPPGLSPCAEAAWKLNRNRMCRNMRQAWDDKWQPGRHADDIRLLDVAIRKLEDFLLNNCAPGCP